MLLSLLNIANNDLPALEDKYKKLQRNVNHLESKELDASITLEEFEKSDTKCKPGALFLPLILSERGKKNAPVAQTEY